MQDSDNARPKDSETIPMMVQAALNAVDVDQRPNLLQNIVVTGGSSLLYGFNERLNNEIAALYPAVRTRLHAPGQTVERKYAAWIGGSILGSLGTFHQVRFYKSK
jgi:actin-related protein 4